MSGIESGTGVDNRTEAVHVPAGQALRLWVPEELPGPFADGEGPLLSEYTLVATAQQTTGSLTGLSIVVPPGNGPPPHRHPGSDESFLVLDGSFAVTAGGQEFTMEPGDYAFVPRGVEHRWRNASSRSARMLLIYTPSDMEQFFTEIGRPIRPGEHAERLTTEDARRAAAVARRQFGPPPEDPAPGVR